MDIKVNGHGVLVKMHTEGPGKSWETTSSVLYAPYTFGDMQYLVHGVQCIK